MATATTTTIKTGDEVAFFDAAEARRHGVTLGDVGMVVNQGAYEGWVTVDFPVSPALPNGKTLLTLGGTVVRTESIDYANQIERRMIACRKLTLDHVNDTADRVDFRCQCRLAELNAKAVGWPTISVSV